MSLTWYKTLPSWSTTRIEPIQIDRFTEQSVFINGRRALRMSQFDCFFPTRDEAKAYIVGKAEQDLDYHKISLARAQSALDLARKIVKEPA
jgi:hypothetical protein